MWASSVLGMTDAAATPTHRDMGDLRALFVNCSLKRSPDRSHTQGLADIAIAVMAANGVSVETVRAVDLDLPPGVTWWAGPGLPAARRGRRTSVTRRGSSSAAGR